MPDNINGLHYKNITIVNDNSRVVSKWWHNLEHHSCSSIVLSELSIMLPELSIMLLENIYSIGITHDNHHMMICLNLIVQAKSIINAHWCPLIIKILYAISYYYTFLLWYHQHQVSAHIVSEYTAKKKQSDSNSWSNNVERVSTWQNHHIVRCWTNYDSYFCQTGEQTRDIFVFHLFSNTPLP